MDDTNNLKREDTDEVKLDILQSESHDDFQNEFLEENKIIQKQCDDYVNIVCSMNYFSLREDSRNIPIYRCNACKEKSLNICSW